MSLSQRTTAAPNLLPGRFSQIREPDEGNRMDLTQNPMPGRLPDRPGSDVARDAIRWRADWSRVPNASLIPADGPRNPTEDRWVGPGRSTERLHEPGRLSAQAKPDALVPVGDPARMMQPGSRMNQPGTGGWTGDRPGVGSEHGSKDGSAHQVSLMSDFGSERRCLGERRNQVARGLHSAVASCWSCQAAYTCMTRALRPRRRLLVATLRRTRRSAGIRAAQSLDCRPFRTLWRIES